MSSENARSAPPRSSSAPRAQRTNTQRDTSSAGSRSRQDRSTTKSSLEFADASCKDPMVPQKKLEIEQRLRSFMSAPVPDRKKVLRDMMLEYHPDKNAHESATELFQFVNSAREWFLAES
mmetsp:Transcript_1027/g.1918  ORF Transcript_1027/g.1918 Transcript_1027/m.1918 type:complete len:120 (-) Transcript_1027:8-367(-)